MHLPARAGSRLGAGRGAGWARAEPAGRGVGAGGRGWSRRGAGDAGRGGGQLVTSAEVKRAQANKQKISA